MPHVYDALMDRLDALAVEAVQRADVAVQVYWLAGAGAVWQATPEAPLSYEALTCHTPSMPPWAKALAPRALIQLLRAGDLIAGRTAGPLPRHDALTEDDLAVLHGAVFWMPQATHLYAAELYTYVYRLWEAVCQVYGARLPQWAAVPQDVWRGAVLFETGCYIACHDYFETLWGRLEDAASDLYQGLIQIAVAMRHLESHNVRGGILLIQYGLARLRRYPAVYKGLPLQVFVEQLTSLLHHLQSLPSPASYAFASCRVPRLLTTEV